jgi:glycosyltransferase involved in cell wall biosynthesis
MSKFKFKSHQVNLKPIIELPPRFSIITATFNSELQFERTAQSLKAQKFFDFEWIIIDGASQDNTIKLILNHTDLISYWISEKDRGISDAWNKGLSFCKGEYILILNSGDTYDPDFLEQINLNTGDGNKIVCSHARLKTDAGIFTGNIYSEPHKLNRGMHIAHNWCAIPRIYYEQFGGYADLSLAMDFEWFHRYFLRYGVEGFKVIDKTLGDYHLGGVSDANFAASFKVNSEILMHYGASFWFAKFWQIIYTAKHGLRSIFQKRSN